MNNDLEHDTEDMLLAELAIKLYLEGLSRELILKKLAEKNRDPKKCERIFKALQKSIRVNRQIDADYARYRTKRSDKERVVSKGGQVQTDARKVESKRERDMDDDYDYCPPLY